MIITGLRIFLFALLPLLVAGIQVMLDKSANSRLRRLETFMIYLFALGVAGSGIGNFFAHFFISDLVAQSIGWPAGNPFQLEVAFANLAIGILGIGAVGRRDGFREATVIAATVFALGATVVHLLDIVETGNLAPGNTLQNVSNLLRPALLIGFLVALRRAERAVPSEAISSAFERWRQPRGAAAGMMTGIVATGFGVGFAIGQPVLGSAAGVIAGAILVWVVLRGAAATPDNRQSTT